MNDVTITALLLKKAYEIDSSCDKLSKAYEILGKEKIKEVFGADVGYAKELIKNTGYEEMSLASLSTSDYPDLKNLLDQLQIHESNNSCRNLFLLLV